MAIVLCHALPQLDIPHHGLRRIYMRMQRDRRPRFRPAQAKMDTENSPRPEAQEPGVLPHWRWLSLRAKGKVGRQERLK
jgi:hypothetical protein